MLQSFIEINYLNWFSKEMYGDPYEEFEKYVDTGAYRTKINLSRAHKARFDASSRGDLEFSNK